jgi:hypothetical protein
MTRALTIALAAMLSLPAQASILGDTVTLDWGDGLAGCLVDAVVVDPGLEFDSVGADLCFGVFDMDVEVTANTVRFDFTTDHAYYTDYVTRAGYSMYTLNNLDPVCADGAPGIVTGITNVTTNFDPLEWQPYQVAFTDSQVQILGDPDALGGDIETYITAGTFIEFEIEYSCPSVGSGSLETDLDGVELDFGDGSTACVLTEMVAPGYEWIGAGPDLCMAGPSGRLDVDVSDDTLRIDFTALQSFGTGGILDLPVFTIGDLEPVCPDGDIGSVIGLGSVTTNMDPLQWVPTDVAYGADYVQILGNPADGLNMDTQIGDFIEIEVLFDCTPGPALAIGGSCPGPMTVDVTGITPGGQVGVISSTALGSDVVPAGLCAGTATGLASPNFMFLLNDTDSDGEMSFTPTVPGWGCGRHLQMVDMTTCTATNVDTI